MKKLGFRTNPNNEKVKDIEGILDFIERKGKERSSLPNTTNRTLAGTKARSTICLLQSAITSFGSC